MGVFSCIFLLFPWKVATRLSGFICCICWYLFTVAVCLNSSISYISNSRINLTMLYSVSHCSQRNISITELSWRNSSKKSNSSLNPQSAVTEPQLCRKSPCIQIPLKTPGTQQLEWFWNDEPFCIPLPREAIAPALRIASDCACGWSSDSLG